MKTKLQLNLNDNEMVHEMAKYFEEKFDDFLSYKDGFLSAIDKLKEEYGEETVTGVICAFNTQTASDMLFAYRLGMQANLEHYRNPFARTFLEVDPEVYLREKVMKNMQYRIEAQKIVDQFRRDLSAEMKVYFEDISAYYTYFENAAPKLAHYHAFMLANEFLGRIEPGYVSDDHLTNAYQRMMEEYFNTAV